MSLNFNERRNDQVISEMGVRVHPALVFIQRDGTIAQRWLGAAGETDLKSIIDGLIAP